MTWRSLMISNPARLKRKLFALVIEQSEAIRVPFEDIAVIVLAHPQIVVTHPVLSACGEYGIALYTIGDNHQPNGVFLPFGQHSRGTRMLRLQLKLDKPSVKRVWQSIVSVKIRNQAECLRLAGRNGADTVELLAKRVRSGDKDNIEAQASARYFHYLFGANFFRNQDSWINAALDYGYAVLRGAIARSLVAHGFLPALGLFHASEQNAFNLADDLIEPYRPLVDRLVVEMKQRHGARTDELQPDDKVALVALLNVDVQMPRGTMSVLSSIEQATKSLLRIYEGAVPDALVELPQLIGLTQHLHES